MPTVFGPWQTIWTWHRRLAREGTWDTALTRLLAAPDAAGQIDWAVSIDSTIARAHQHATNVTRHTGAGANYTNPHPDLLAEPPDHAIGRSRGGLTTKIHHLVDRHGYPLVALFECWPGRGLADVRAVIGAVAVCPGWVGPAAYPS